MNLLTYGVLKNTLARASGTCATSSEILDLANEAQERLLNRANKPVGCLIRYRFCSNDSCIVLPRQIRTVEAFAVCDTLGIVRPEWHEFLGNGVHIYDSDDMPGTAMIDKGRVSTFADITSGSTTSKIKVVSSVAENNDSEILLLGYDDNAQWVRTLQSGSWADGEKVSITAAGTTSSTTWSHIVQVIKPVTKGVVRLYEVDSTTGNTIQTLAIYEPSETLPVYRKMFIPGLANMGKCEGTESDCDQKAITVLAKVQHIPVAVDNDFMIIGNVAALKLMAMAIEREEQNRLEEAAILEGKAIAELEGELASYLGDGNKVTIKTDDHSVFGAGVFNPI